MVKNSMQKQVGIGQIIGCVVPINRSFFSGDARISFAMAQNVHGRQSTRLMPHPDGDGCKNCPSAKGGDRGLVAAPHQQIESCQEVHTTLCSSIGFHVNWFQGLDLRWPAHCEDEV